MTSMHSQREPLSSLFSSARQEPRSPDLHSCLHRSSLIPLLFWRTPIHFPKRLVCSQKLQEPGCHHAKTWGQQGSHLGWLQAVQQSWPLAPWSMPSPHRCSPALSMQAQPGSPGGHQMEEKTMGTWSLDAHCPLPALSFKVHFNHQGR